MTGIILLDKPQNMTSFSAANRVRRILGVKKAGHTGTLDPMATGVLPIALSNSTRFIELLPVHDKQYLATAKLGITTDTLDITGTVLSESAVSVTSEQVHSAVHKFTGDIMQTPPMYSAIKKDGQRLYDLARQGVEIEREARRVTIHNIDLISFENNEFTFTVSCSAGTYVRSLCDDIGKILGCGAVMTSLRRTSANGFSINECITFSELENAVNNNEAEKHVKPIDSCFSCYEKITVTEPQSARFHNGGSLLLERLKKQYAAGLYRVYSPKDEFLGLGEVKDGEDSLFVRRVFVND